MIKSIYYWSLCKVDIDYKSYFVSTSPETEMTNNEYSNTEVYCGLTAAEIMAIRNGKEHHAQYTKTIEDGDIHIFVIADYQMECFLDDMARRGLMQYKVYESPKFSNLNYPENGRCLTLFLFHYKDFKHE